MELINKNIKVKTNNGEIKSIFYKGIEILYQGNQGWKKTFPIIFPVLGFSEAFEVNEKKYRIPKHGFWNDLKWEEFIENNDLVLSATHIKNEIYPFTIDIQQFISLSDNGIMINTKISNISSENAYFHFGLHPAFNIDKDSEFIYKTNKKPLMIDFKGKLLGKYEFNNKFMQEKFGIKFDTLVYKDVDNNECSYNYKNLTISILHDANNLQLWKPKEDMFICIEPWYGVGDREKKIIKNAKNKEQIINLPTGKTWSSTMIIKFTI